jgi:hypothetical protein
VVKEKTREDVAEFFGGLSAARVIIEVGTHSAWVREVVMGCGHEVLVANPRLMDRTKRRKRKNDRIDAHKLARLGRVDPQSLYPMEHRSTEVRQDLGVLPPLPSFSERDSRSSREPSEPPDFRYLDWCAAGPASGAIWSRRIFQPPVCHTRQEWYPVWRCARPAAGLCVLSPADLRQGGPLAIGEPPTWLQTRL